MGSGIEVFAFLSFARLIKAFSTKSIVLFKKLISNAAGLHLGFGVNMKTENRQFLKTALE